jgi:hypothetical protein
MFRDPQSIGQTNKSVAERSISNENNMRGWNRLSNQRKGVNQEIWRFDISQCPDKQNHIVRPDTGMLIAGAHEPMRKQWQNSHAANTSLAQQEC